MLINLLKKISNWPRCTSYIQIPIFKHFKTNIYNIYIFVKKRSLKNKINKQVTKKKTWKKEWQRESKEELTSSMAMKFDASWNRWMFTRSNLVPFKHHLVLMKPFRDHLHCKEYWQTCRKKNKTENCNYKKKIEVMCNLSQIILNLIWCTEITEVSSLEFLFLGII